MPQWAEMQTVLTGFIIDMKNFVGSIVSFLIPHINASRYLPGRQPNNPGESQIDFIGNGRYRSIPWPNPVPVLRVLASNAGTPRDRALQIDNNSYASLPANYLFIAGFAGKSRG